MPSPATCRLASLDEQIAAQHAVIARFDTALWENGFNAALLPAYQSAWRRLETLLAKRDDPRHHFVIVIPVADSPAQLQRCLASLIELCRAFGYGGMKDGYFSKVSVLLADDSESTETIAANQALVGEFTAKGLAIEYFGLSEQLALLDTLPDLDLSHIIGNAPREAFGHKGQAIMRNLAYLHLAQRQQSDEPLLVYTLDADQQFKVNVDTADGDVCAVNFFAQLDAIFSASDADVLTGKVVGDPPVSPAVMAGTFLDDVAGFLHEMAASDPAQPYYQNAANTSEADAAYHDMAGLFGFENRPASFPYPCRLESEHDHGACLRDFASRLNAFFFGEHLFRKTWFSYGSGFTLLTPARTVYPGNYIVNYAGLKYIIPFGHLRLRMSGPTAGRLIAAEIAGRFASFNMPNLHRRTTEAGLDDDFRPGVKLGVEQQSIDLSNEFERQFFGDLMLFSTEELVKEADVNQPFAREAIEAVIARKEAELLALYQQKHDAIVGKNRQLNELVFNAGHWWLNSPELAAALRQVQAFIDNIDRNFGERALAWHQIQSAGHRAERKRQIVEALMNYRAERDAWDSLF
ncbi:MAG: hypothetical protein Q7V00_02670 [Sulfurimicrobium sp.]|nr:hypothetical protein [Sulfurimicrobium sp.]